MNSQDCDIKKTAAFCTNSAAQITQELCLRQKVRKLYGGLNGKACSHFINSSPRADP